MGELDKPARARNKKVTEKDKETFLEGLRLGMTHREAAERACHPPQTFYYVRKHNPEFGEAVKEAMDIGTDVLEQEARRRAVEGWEEPVVGKVSPGIDGHVIGPDGKPMFVRKHDGRLLELLLKGRRHEYRDNPKVQIDQRSVNIAIEDRSAALEDVAKVLLEAGVNLGIENRGGSSRQELPIAGELLAESEDV